jgi:V/A-type H+-transporting ATPase subunit C
MAAIIGPSPYIYVCTRLRVRKAKLIPREEYLRMLNMSLPEITRVIQEMEYKREIDELSHAFSGINLIEVALSWNLAKNYQNVITITPGGLLELTQRHLRRWDIQNVLTILRGISQGMAKGKIKEVLIPAGELDRAHLDRLLAEDSVERIIELLKGWRLYPVLKQSYPGVVESGSFAQMENDLYKEFYADITADARSGISGGKAFLDYIILEIDTRNLQNLFRIRFQRERGDVTRFMIPGGTFTVEELQRFSDIENFEEFIDAIKAQVRSKPILSMLEKARMRKSPGEGSLHENEITLTRLQVAQMERMAKLNPFSIWAILAYLEMKKYEIFNLRAITRGKEANLSADRIKGYLVM